MRARTFAIVTLCVVATGCNLLKRGDADGGGAITAPGSSGGGIVAKGLSLAGAAAFQGELDMIIKSDKGGSDGLILVKGAKQRMEFHTPDSKTTAMIMDGDAKKMIVLDDARKTATVMSLEKPDVTPPSTPPPGAPAGVSPKQHEFKRTDKKDVVAGYDCEIWTYEEPDKKGEICVAGGFSLLGMGGMSLGALNGKIDGMPLRAIGQTKDGKEKERWEVTKIERRSVPDDKFQVPPGYQTTDMDQLMKGLGGLRGPRPKR